MVNVIKNFIILDDDSVNNMLCTKFINKVFPEAYVITFTEPDMALSFIALLYEKVTIPDTVLLLDINMPVLSGWDFLDAFERFDVRIKARFNIYMLTSSFDTRDKKRADENINVLGFLEKPLNREKIESIAIVVNDDINIVAE